MTPRIPGSRASLWSMRRAAAAEGRIASGDGSERYSPKVYGCSAEDGGPESAAREEPRDTCPFRRRRRRRSSSSKPTTRWSTCEAASSAAMSAAAVPMSIRGLAFALEVRPGTDATASVASPARDGTRTPPRATRRASGRRSSAWRRTRPSRLERHAEVAHGGVRGDVHRVRRAAIRHAHAHFLHPPRSRARASRYAARRELTRVQPASSARARFSSRGDPSRRARGCRVAVRPRRLPHSTPRANRDMASTSATIARSARASFASPCAPSRARARRDVDARALASSASLVPKGGDILRAQPHRRAPLPARPDTTAVSPRVVSPRLATRRTPTRSAGSRGTPRGSHATRRPLGGARHGRDRAVVRTRRRRRQSRLPRANETIPPGRVRRRRRAEA